METCKGLLFFFHTFSGKDPVLLFSFGCANQFTGKKAGTTRLSSLYWNTSNKSHSKHALKHFVHSHF